MAFGQMREETQFRMHSSEAIIMGKQIKLIHLVYRKQFKSNYFAGIAIESTETNEFEKTKILNSN